MKHKIFLTSAFAMCTIVPAMATPTNTSSTFPNDELMQADYTYTNQATYPNTGVYDGDVTAEAQYDWTLINLEPGYFLPKNSTTPTECRTKYYCPGATGIHYDSENVQGRESCSTVGDGSYRQSDAGSTSENNCYKDCDVAVANIAHAVAVSGRDYYGTGIDTCVASACQLGYHVVNGACVINTINITWNGATAAAISANEAGTCTYGGDIRTPQTYDSTAVPTGKHFVGWKFVKSETFNLSSLIVSGLDVVNGTSYGYINGYPSNYGDSYQEYNVADYGLTDSNTWGTTFSYGKLRGIALCSDTNDGKELGQAGNPGDGIEAPRYCWCKLDGIQASGESTWQNISSAPWVLRTEYDNTNCKYSCASACGGLIGDSSFNATFRRGLFGASN